MVSYLQLFSSVVSYLQLFSSVVSYLQQFAWILVLGELYSWPANKANSYYFIFQPFIFFGWKIASRFQPFWTSWQKWYRLSACLPRMFFRVSESSYYTERLNEMWWILSVLLPKNNVLVWKCLYIKFLSLISLLLLCSHHDRLISAPIIIHFVLPVGSFLTKLSK